MAGYSVTTLQPTETGLSQHAETTLAASVLTRQEAGSASTARAGGLRAFNETTKPGITRLVTITSLVGFTMGALHLPWDRWTLAGSLAACAVGTYLSAAGANAVNQFMERSRDGLMLRTQRRPLPEGRIAPRAVLWWGLVLGALGVLLLAVVNGLVPAAVSLLCFLTYVLAYTPLKTRTTLNTYVGGIPGALPPLIGWTAASGGEPASLLHPGGLTLFAIMFAWQVPHFMAIAWMYRDDYARGGYRMLTVVDPDGRRTATTIAAWTAVLLPLTLLPFWTMSPLLGLPYPAVAMIAGAGFLILAARVIRTREVGAARAMFFGSIIHLPILLLAMIGEAVIRTALRGS